MKKLLSLLAISVLALPLLADRIVLNDGSVLNGTLKTISGGTATVETDFAGTLTIPADRIVKLNTLGAVHMVTKDGQRVDGRITTREATPAPEAEAPAPEAPAAEAAAPAPGPLSLTLGSVEHLWLDGMADPTVPPKRAWEGEFSVDIAGKTGNSEKFNGGVGTVATLSGPIDKWKLYANAQYGRENHNTNTKKYLAGTDYERKICESPYTWYANGEVEQQTTSGLRLREEVGGGLGYYIFENPVSSLRVRAGLSAKSRKYTDGSHSDAMGGQFSAHYERNIQEWGKLVTDLTYQPSLDDIHDYRILHESSLDIPVLFQYPMSLRVGVSNEYNSRVVDDARRMETSYFAKMVFKWK